MNNYHQNARTTVSRPRISPGRMPVKRVATIAAMRRMRTSSVESALSLPISSVTLELRRLGHDKLSRLEPKLPVMRYEHGKPGDMPHLDIKKLGRIDGVGHPGGDRFQRQRGAGWEYLHVCVDDNSRLAYSSFCPMRKP